MKEKNKARITGNYFFHLTYWSDDVILANFLLKSEDLHRILIIDDNSSFRDLLKLFFLNLSAHWSIIEAADGREALNYLTNDHFDLIICDIDLPDITGFVIVDYLKKSLNQTPIIAVTGLTNYPVDFYLKNGFSAKFDKLVVFSELRNILDFGE